MSAATRSSWWRSVAPAGSACWTAACRRRTHACRCQYSSCASAVVLPEWWRRPPFGYWCRPWRRSSGSVAVDPTGRESWQRRRAWHCSVRTPWRCSASATWPILCRLSQLARCCLRIAACRGGYTTLCGAPTCSWQRTPDVAGPHYGSSSPLVLLPVLEQAWLAEQLVQRRTWWSPCLVSVECRAKPRSRSSSWVSCPVYASGCGCPAAEGEPVSAKCPAVRLPPARFGHSGFQSPPA